MTMGNHELYDNKLIDYIGKNVSTFLGEKYICGNVKHIDEQIQMSRKYKSYSLEGFGNITVLGFIFDFPGHGNHSTITPFNEVLNSNEDWVQEAFSLQNLRLIVCVAHLIPENIKKPEEDEWKVKILPALKEKTQGNIPIILLGGHDHILYNSTEAKLVKMESGFYFHKVGVLTFKMEKLPQSSASSTSSFSGISESQADEAYSIIHSPQIRYINTSRCSFQKETNKNDTNFITSSGQDIKILIAAKAEELHLGDKVGCSKKFWNGSFECKEENSLYKLYVDEIYPQMSPFKNNRDSTVLKQTREKVGSLQCEVENSFSFSASATVASSSSSSMHNNENEAIYFVNKGFIRNHLYEEEVLFEDIAAVDPFENKFSAIYDVDGEDLEKLMEGEVDKAVDPNAIPIALSKEHILKQSRLYMNELFDEPFERSEYEQNHQTMLQNGANKVKEGKRKLSKTTPFKEYFAFTNITEVKKNQKYDLISNEYSMSVAFKALNKTVPNKYLVTVHKAFSRDALKEYVSKNMVCGLNDDPKTEDSPKKLSKAEVGGIVGGSVGGMAIIGGSVLAIVFVKRRRKYKV
ncbi:putative ser/Thr protein phosphatase [Monocercomonoides exilis]|uniref:putative ser/Thr protein phosphatase n=1 Tax=Monocercomonoides exilis TaxID=2049356 RepID=UPI003559BBDE|nr:putative ser/Thr protein phosphatase [Monocercomonoides exilis]|eukprot:MONOS_11764.1-p1 / transcript=MONOS_11764.1 / gene=MONOS_11764 / organism=Monocercomonoides_exilis_PA203 / gene_product=ser / transcript_product=ser / location=Mono_scaffold00609:8092-9890(+) / protein_length=576 / sequence_SO=supercontig / SO=protein_coding / is_pseudo=false